MSLLRRPFLSVGLILLSLTGSLFAASTVRNGAVEASLVARETSIQPGRSFLVALVLDHDEHWHSYWINPGTGYPTSLEWKLPAGFTAGPIIWPTPHVVKDTRGNVTGNGYEHRSYYFVEITPPLPGFGPSEKPGQTPGGQQTATGSLAPGDSITLHVTADWLMCKDVCMPGNAVLDLTLPVSADEPRENPATARNFNQQFAELPQPISGWQVTATRKDQTFTLILTPAAGTTHRPEGLHLFDTAGLIDYAAPQTVREENGSIIMSLAAASDAPAAAVRLAGELVSTNGWGPSSVNKGALLDVGIGAMVLSGNRPNENPGQTRATGNRPPSTGSSGLLGTLVLAFVGGIILNLMPCVFPVLAIKILGFVNQSGNDRKKITAHGLVFALGVLVSFWALAGLLLVLRAGGAQLGWGFQLQSPAFVFAMASFLLIFALNLSGLFEIGLSATGVGGKLQMKEGFGGSFFTGALATLVATPCSAPFLAPALGAALALSAGQSILVFTAIAVGLALPYLLLSIFPSAIKLLPRPGAWMETFKQFMAFPLYATVGWLLWVLAGQTKDDDNALLLITFGFILIAMAAWVYGRFVQAHGKPRRQRVGLIFAVLLLIGGLYTGWPKDAPTASTDGSYQVTWDKWSPDAITAAQTAGHYVYVDFTARWCATCQTNKAAVFHNDAVLAELAKKKVVLLRGDWTNRDPKITTELARWNRSAVPFNLIYAPGKTEPVILPELLTPDRVLEAFASVSQNEN